MITIMVLTIGGGAVGYVVSRGTEPSYLATTTLLVGDLDRPDLAKPEFQTTAMVTAIFGGLIRSEIVLSPVIDRLDLATNSEELRDRIHVDLGRNDVPTIAVTVYARTAAEATATASAIADRMLELSRSGLGGRPSSGVKGPSEELAKIQQTISSTEQRLSGLEAQLTSSLSSSDRARIQRSIDLESSLLMSWLEVYGGRLSTTAASANDLRILQPADTNGARVRPDEAIDIGLGASVALLLGIAIALAMRRAFPAESRRPRESGSPAPIDLEPSDTTRTAPAEAIDPWARELAHSAQDG